MYIVILIFIFFNCFAMDDPNDSFDVLYEKNTTTQEEKFMQDIEQYLLDHSKLVIDMNNQRFQEAITIAKLSNCETYRTPIDGPFFFDEEIKKLPDGSISLKKTLERNLHFEKRYSTLLGGLNYYCKEQRFPSIYRIFENFLLNRTFTIDQIEALKRLAERFEMAYQLNYSRAENGELRAEDQRLRKSFAVCLENVRNYEKYKDSILRITNFDTSNNKAHRSMSAPTLTGPNEEATASDTTSQRGSNKSPLRTRSESHLPKMEPKVQTRDRSNTISL